MRKFLFLSLFALLATAFPGLAQDKALTKTALTYSTTSDQAVSENRFRVPYAGCGKTMPFTDNDSYSVSFWVNRTALTGLSSTSYKNEAVIASMGTAQHANFNGHFVLSVDDEGAMTVGGWGLPGASGTIAGKTLSLNTWTFFCITYDNANLKFRVYMNEEMVYEGTLERHANYNESGEMPACFQFGSFGFTGSLDNIALYNRALDEDEALIAYSAPEKLTDEIASLYKFDDVTDPGLNALGTDYGAQLELYTGGHGEYQGGISGAQGATVGDDTYPNAKVEKVTENLDTYFTDDTFTKPEIPVKTQITIPELPTFEHATLVIKDKDGHELHAGDQVTYEYGDKFFIEATADEDWVITDIERLLRHLSTTDHFYPVYDTREWREITMSFAPKYVNLTVVNANNYPVTIAVTDKDGNPVEPVDLTKVPYNATVTVTPGNHEVLHLDGVALDGADLTAADNVYSFVRPNADCTLTITSHAVGAHKVIIARTEGGTVTVTANGEEVKSGSYVAEGTVLTITYTPNEGYAAKCNVNDVATASGSTYTVGADDVKVAVIFYEDNTEVVEQCEPTPVEGRAQYTSGCEANQTIRTDRYVNSIKVSDGNGNEITVAGGGTTTPRPIYYDRSSQILKTEAGRTISLEVNGAGVWMNTFIYADFNGNGLAADDQVYTNYTWGDGEEAVGNGVGQTYSFVIPEGTPAGLYRVRYMLNWNKDQGPCQYGQAAEDAGDHQNENGESIIDFTIQVGEPVDNTPQVPAAANVYELTAINVTGDGNVTVSSSADGQGIVYVAGDGLYLDAPVYVVFTPDTDRAFISGTVTNAEDSNAFNPAEDVNAAVDGSVTVKGDVAVTGVFGTTSTGIDGIEADEADEANAVYYNLQGIRVNRDNLSTGIYIRKAGKKVTKVLITK